MWRTAVELTQVFGERETNIYAGKKLTNVGYQS